VTGFTAAFAAGVLVEGVLATGVLATVVLAAGVLGAAVLSADILGADSLVSNDFSVATFADGFVDFSTAAGDDVTDLVVDAFVIFAAFVSSIWVSRVGVDACSALASGACVPSNRLKKLRSLAICEPQSFNAWTNKPLVKQYELFFQALQRPMSN
jgi:hypothetical protein